MTLTKSYYTTRIFLIIPQNNVLLEFVLITRLRRFRDKNLIDKISPVVSGRKRVGWISVRQNELTTLSFVFYFCEFF